MRIRSVLLGLIEQCTELMNALNLLIKSLYIRFLGMKKIVSSFYRTSTII